MSVLLTAKSNHEHIQYFELFFSFKGRLSRRIFWCAVLVILISYLNCYLVLNLFSAVNKTTCLYLFVPFFYAYLAIAVKRLHDLNQSGYRLFWFIVPVLGAFFLNIQLLFCRGNDQKNHYDLKS